MQPLSLPRHRVPIPACRDPFVNTPLLPLPVADGDAETFWISSYNGAFGCLGAVVDLTGGARVYRTENFRWPGFYCAVAAEPGKLWLCGMADELVELDLTSGVFTAYPNDVPRSLVFAGMTYDEPTGRLFAGSYSGDFIAWEFDTRQKRTVRTYRDFTDLHYMRDGFPNGDGSYTVVCVTPGLGLVRWTPGSDTLRVRKLADSINLHDDGHLWYRSIVNEKGHRYLPRYGWYDMAADTFVDGPEPDRELGWFDYRDGVAYGLGDGRLAVWDVAANTPVRLLGELEGADKLNVRITTDGLVVWVDRAGFVSVYDPAAETLASRFPLPTDSVQSVDCVLRCDADTIVGTPFISQRFWRADIPSGAGQDLGRAAPGGGEILQTWWLNDRAYLAAYAGGELTCYDPARPPGFPENPYVVATPPGAMRPVAAADDGTRLWYSSSRHYGKLGSVLCCYDTAGHRASHLADPLPDQQVNSLHYLPSANHLQAGSSPRADCDSAPPSQDAGCLALLDADSMAPLHSVSAPTGFETVRALGQLDDGRLLWILAGPRGDLRWYWWASDPAPGFAAPQLADLAPIPGRPKSVLAAGSPGHVILWIDDRVEIWRFPDAVRIAIIDEGDEHLCRLQAQPPDLHLVRPWDIVIVDAALSPASWTSS